MKSSSRLMSTLSRSAILTVGLATIGACGPRSGVGPSTTQPPPAAGSLETKALGFELPASVRSYRLTESYPVEGHPRDRGFRYSDGSRTRVSVFVYPADSAVAVAEPRRAVASEGPLFSESLPVGVQRGWYDAYNVAFAHADSLEVDGQLVFGHVTAAPTKSDGRVNVEFQYLYLVGTRFVKVRATVPAEGWRNTDVPLLAKELAAMLTRQFRSAQ